MSYSLSIPADLFDVGYTPHENQKLAVELAAANRVTVLTGGPGTGKTATTNWIIEMLERNGLKVGLCAPTGKAAVRMREQTKRKATTIHRMLGWQSDGTWRFCADEPVTFNADGQPMSGPLPYDALVVDEVSMVDTVLMAGILNALTPDQRVVLVGDVDQLPSIGAGRVLFDLIESGVVPTVRLTKIFRQASESRIPYVARDINAGDMPDLSELSMKSGSDVAWLELDAVEDVAATIVEAVVSLLPERRGFEPDDIQVIVPQHKTPVGDEELNRALQQRLNKNFVGDDKYGVRAGRDYRLFAGDRVLHANRNNYELNVANGEVGKVIDTNWRGIVVDPTTVTTSGAGKPIVLVDFGDRVVGFNKQEAQNLELGYAITIHKSQGSQFPCVVVPVHGANEFMLTRPLLYTALTRAEKACLMIGQATALDKATKNTRGVSRNTTLQPCLRECATVA